MISLKINLATIDAVKEFVNIINTVDFEADLIAGKYVVDAKSIMGIFSLDLAKPLNLSLHTDKCDELLEKISKFKA